MNIWFLAENWIKHHVSSTVDSSRSEHLQLWLVHHYLTTRLEKKREREKPSVCCVISWSVHRFRSCTKSAVTYNPKHTLWYIFFSIWHNSDMLMSLLFHGGECELLKWLFNKSDWQEQKRVKHLGVFFLHLESQDCKLPDSFKRDFQPSWHTKRGGVWIEVWVSVCCNWFSGNEPAAWEKCQWAHWATGKWSTLNSWGLPNDVFPYFWQLFFP